MKREALCDVTCVATKTIGARLDSYKRALYLKFPLKLQGER